MHLGSLPYLCIENETMAPLHVATITVQREVKKKIFILPTGSLMPEDRVLQVSWRLEKLSAN